MVLSDSARRPRRNRTTAEKVMSLFVIRRTVPD